MFYYKNVYFILQVKHQYTAPSILRPLIWIRKTVRRVEVEVPLPGWIDMLKMSYVQRIHE